MSGSRRAADSPRLFIGSSSEGRDVARHLEAELGSVCDVIRWDRDVFEPSGYALDSLITTAYEVDFAVLIATPDDTTVSRGEKAHAPRDNIVLEFGLFAAALGRKRTYLLATGEQKLPTDVLGLTRLTYRSPSNGNHRAAVNEAALQIEEQIRNLGPIERDTAKAGATAAPEALSREIDLVCDNAVSQGWTVRTNSPTTLRLRSPRGKVLTLSKGQPQTTREELRRFAAELRAAGLRVNRSLRTPVDQSPF